MSLESACVNPTLPKFPGSYVSDQEQAVWEKILTQHGLNMERGTPDWLEFGASYFDHEQSHTYDAGDKRPDKRTAANLLRAKEILAVMETGLSMKKAAKQLGIPQQTACYILKRYREISTLPKFPGSNEGQ